MSDNTTSKQAHFNKLSPQEAELLALLAEECGEVVQAVGKILRHGYNSCHPEHLDGPDNRDNLNRELGHVQAAIRLLWQNDDIFMPDIENSMDEKLIAVRKWMHHL